MIYVYGWLIIDDIFDFLIASETCRRSQNAENVRFFFKGGGIGAIVVHPFSMVSFFTCTTPNRSRVSAIDNPDLSEQVFDQYNIPEDLEKNFTHDFSMVSHEKTFIFGVLDTFISNFTYYNLY